MRKAGSSAADSGTEPIRGKFPAIMPNISRIEQITSMYTIKADIMTSIQAVSRVFDHKTMAKKAAKAPKIKWLYNEIICPRSMVILLPFNPKKNKTVGKKHGKKGNFIVYFLMTLYNRGFWAPNFWKRPSLEYE